MGCGISTRHLGTHLQVEAGVHQDHVLHDGPLSSNCVDEASINRVQQRETRLFRIKIGEVRQNQLLVVLNRPMLPGVSESGAIDLEGSMPASPALTTARSF